MTEPDQQPDSQCVLLIDDDADFLAEAQRALKSHAISSDTLQDGSQAVHILARGKHSVVCLDWVMPGVTGAELLSDIIRLFPYLPVIILTGVSDLGNVVTCIKQGAYDYITKPLDAAKLVSVVQKAFVARELTSQNRKLTGYLQGQPLANPEFFSDIITCNERMLAIFKIIEASRTSRQPVLITGETGVGKELIAKAIHRASGLKGALVTVNVASLDDTMLSDTLFGHKKGAYTGATENRMGLIEQAKGGTLFLDEIGDLSPASQVRLLRLLQQNEYYRLGSDVLHKSDARILTASNAQFDRLLAAGSFRQDLYYRVSSLHLHIPPLRERREDILPLVRHYLEQICTHMNRPVPRLSGEARQALLNYDFPGNVRELINRVSIALTYSRNDILMLEDFHDLKPGTKRPGTLLRRVGSQQFILHGVFPEFPTLDEVEQFLVEEAMAESNGHRGIASELLGISRPTLQKRLARIEGKRYDEED